jgi:type I site-specific restriction-modification system R (restriction) subunit
MGCTKGKHGQNGEKRVGRGVRSGEKAKGLIVDYSDMLRSLREALAQYALGHEGAGQEEIVAPIEDEDSVTLGICEAELRAFKAQFDHKGFL